MRNSDVKPIMILPPNAMSKADIDLLNTNDLCVVIAEDPALVKFVDPLPAQSSRNEVENAAIQLSRRLLHSDSVHSRGDVTKIFVDLLTKGTPISAGPTDAEIRERFFQSEKANELKRLAIEEARAERAEARQKKRAASEGKK